MTPLPADLRVRPLEPSDEPALTELAQICDETYVEWTPPGWMVPKAPRGWANRYFNDDAWGRVAFAGSQLVATVTFRRDSRAEDEWTAIAARAREASAELTRRLSGHAPE